MKNVDNYKKVKLYHYCHIEREGWLELHVDIWFDNCFLYEMFDTELCLYFRNGYDEDGEVLPLVICEDPYVPIPCELKISIAHYLEVCAFVKKYKNTLTAIANNKITDWPYQCNFQEILSEEKKVLINEMPALSCELTGLPMRIWVDNNETYKLGGHGKRIKFDDGRSNITKEWPSLTIPDFNTVPDKNKIQTASKNIDLLRSFCLVNKKPIDDVMDKKITFDQFKKEITRIDKNGHPIKKEVPYYTYKDAGYGYKIVVDSKTGLFNYVNKNGELLSDKWFYEAYPFAPSNTNQFGAVVKLEDSGKYYFFRKNGSLFPID